MDAPQCILFDASNGKLSLGVVIIVFGSSSISFFNRSAPSVKLYFCNIRMRPTLTCNFPKRNPMQRR